MCSSLGLSPEYLGPEDDRPAIAVIAAALRAKPQKMEILSVDYLVKILILLQNLSAFV